MPAPAQRLRPTTSAPRFQWPLAVAHGLFVAGYWSLIVGRWLFSVAD